MPELPQTYINKADHNQENINHINIIGGEEPCNVQTTFSNNPSRFLTSGFYTDHNKRTQIFCKGILVPSSKKLHQIRYQYQNFRVGISKSRIKTRDAKVCYFIKTKNVAI